ncbi:unnamed protein product, partial [Staurois parvus]
MALGREGLTSGAIKGLTVCCFTMCSVFVIHCKHTAMQNHANQMAVLCSVPELTGRRTVSKQKQSSSPSVITGNHKAPSSK